MMTSMFEEYMKEKIPREDDKALFQELYEIYKKEGKEELQKHLKKLISQLEG